MKTVHFLNTYFLSISRLNNLNEDLETLHLAPTQSYNLSGYYPKI